MKKRVPYQFSFILPRSEAELTREDGGLMIMTKTGYEDEIEKIRQIREEVEEAERDLDAVAIGKLIADDVAMIKYESRLCSRFDP